MSLDYSIDDELHLAVTRAFIHYSTDELLKLLTDESPIVRAAAAKQLQVRGGDVVFNQASILAKDASPRGREVAAFLLGQLGTPECHYASKSFPLLLQLIRDDNILVSSTAVAAIGSLGTLGKQPPAELLDAIVEFSTRPEVEARLAAADALWAIDGQEIETMLTRLAKDPNRRVAKAAKLSRELRDDRSNKQRD